jgi:hypothetical protein
MTVIGCLLGCRLVRNGIRSEVCANPGPHRLCS